MLAKRTVVAGDGFTVVDVRCGCGRSGWSPTEISPSYGLVFVRSGCFRREADGVETLLDANAVYFDAPGREQRIAHPGDGGDRCTWIELSTELMQSLLGEVPRLPLTSLFTSPYEDLAHRRLLACHDALEAEELVVTLSAAVLGRIPLAHVAAARSATTAARRRIVDEARELLTEDPRISLVELARRVAVSPHHLSRVFAAETGETISRYRNRLRARVALEGIADGEPSLARLAAELGFADHAHLTRVVRGEAGVPPSRLRHLLRRPD
jgi:AraC-like DNA-binding protein